MTISVTPSTERLEKIKSKSHPVYQTESRVPPSTLSKNKQLCQCLRGSGGRCDSEVNQQHLTQQYKVYSQAINHPLPQKIELSAWHKKKTNTSTLIPTRCCYRDRNIENGDRDTRLSASAADKVDWGWDLSANSRWLFGGWVVIYCGWADNVRREVDLINSLGLNLGIELVIEWECGPLNLYNLSLDF